MDNATLPDFPPGYLEEDHGPRVIAANTTILVVSTILFALRLIARSLTPAKRGWDDHVLIPAYIFLLGLIITLYSTYHLVSFFIAVPLLYRARVLMFLVS